MKKLVKTFKINEAVEIAKNNNFFDNLLRLFPNNAGINLCNIDEITIKCTDDKYGELTDLNISFRPCDGHDDKIIETNGGPWPWLKRSADNSKVELINYN